MIVVSGERNSYDTWWTKSIFIWSAVSSASLGQIEALGHIIEQIGATTFRIGRGADAERPAVGQVPGILFRLHRAIGLVQFCFPGPEIRLLRQLARGAKPVEHARIIGIAV